jgi:predicted PurR-regulated permease PerM
MLALRVPFALPLAVWVAVADLIPMVGATLGATACVIVALASGNLWSVLALIAFFVVYQSVENYVLVPRIMRGSVQIPSLAVLVAALLGGRILGLVGALMAIPVAAAIAALVAPLVRARDEEEPEPEPAGEPLRDKPMIAPDA